MHLRLSFFELSHNQIYFFSTLFLSYLPSSTCFLSLAFLCIVLLSSLHAQMDGSRSLTRGSTLVNRVSFLCPSLCFSLLLLSPQWTPQWFWLTQQSNLKPLNCHYWCGSSYCLLLLLSYLSFFVCLSHSYVHPPILLRPKTSFFPTIRQSLQYVSMKVLGQLWVYWLGMIRFKL